MGSSIQIYAITLTNGIVGNSASGTDGFVDPTRLETYYGQLGGWAGLETWPTDVLAPGLTLALSEAKRRANLRYRRIVIELELMGNVFILPASLASNATAVTEGTTLSFQLGAERGAASLTTRDELNHGEFLLGAAAVQRAIARALTDSQTLAVDVYDPTPTASTGLGASVSIARFGVRLNGQIRFDQFGNPVANTGFFVGPYVGGSLPAALNTANNYITVTPLIPAAEVFN
jgi:hypothetical protein